MGKINSHTVIIPEFTPSFMDIDAFKNDYISYADRLEIINPLK